MRFASVLTAAAMLTLSACGNAAGKVEGAKPGATVKLSGDQGVLTLKGKSWSPAITVDAKDATFTGIVLDGVTGIHIKGGTVIGAGGRSYGIRVLSSHDVAVDGMIITGAHRGVVIDRSQDVAIRGNELTGLISDGIDMASSQRVTIERNSCSKFVPKMATFDADGTRHDGDHPDCIQGWSAAGQVPTGDVTVANNHADGVMQGIFFGDKGGGGFDRITIRDNVLNVGLSNAILVANARGLVMRGNRVTAVVGATNLRNGKQIKANVTIVGSTEAVACGNQIPDVPKHLATRACR